MRYDGFDHGGSRHCSRPGCGYVPHSASCQGSTFGSAHEPPPWSGFPEPNAWGHNHPSGDHCQPGCPGWLIR